MTPRRAQVLTYWRKHPDATLGQIVRACGFYHRSAAKRVLDDLRQMDAMASKSNGEAPYSAKTALAGIRCPAPC